MLYTIIMHCFKNFMVQDNQLLHLVNFTHIIIDFYFSLKNFDKVILKIFLYFKV